jgi:hypothetical protein
MFFPW